MITKIKTIMTIARTEKQVLQVVSNNSVFKIIYKVPAY